VPQQCRLLPPRSLLCRRRTPSWRNCVLSASARTKWRQICSELEDRHPYQFQARCPQLRLPQRCFNSNLLRQRQRYTLGPEHVKRHVHDLSTWLEAFTKFINIASQIAPHRLSELLTYQATIITANNQFYPEAWLAYDLNFRSNAAADPTRRWDVVDTNLWQMSFTGKARPSCPACRLTHPATGGRCPFRPSKAITDQPARQQNSQRTICRNFNHGRCTYPNCRHAHICCPHAN